MSRGRELAFKFHDKLQKLLSRKARHSCMYPGCTDPAIHAHEISKEHSLRGIAEGGKLFMPISIRDDNNVYKVIEFKPIGIQEATTFKGFCQPHDSLFSSIDTKGIVSYRDVFLQLYRSLASEYFIYSAYQKSERYSGQVRDFNEALEKSKSISTSRALMLFHDLITDFPEALSHLPEGNRLKLKPFSKKEGMESSILVRRIRFNCQVALHKKFSLQKDGCNFDTFVFVVPSDAGATMIILCRPDDAEELLGQVRTDLDTLNFLESCMMNDGLWWLAPSVIEGWSKEKLKLIESDYWAFHEREYLEPYDVSLFDQVREQLCQYLPPNIQETEITKINRLPEREDFALRRLRYSMRAFENQNRINTIFPNNE